VGKKKSFDDSKEAIAPVTSLLSKVRFESEDRTLGLKPIPLEPYYKSIQGGEMS
jgi:hypothetical protein